jgi:uncharacterized membrane protein YozB (DUF420 family)
MKKFYIAVVLDLRLVFVMVMSEVSLVLEIFVLILIVFAVGLKTRKKFREHGLTMLGAVALHIVSILAIMVPSLGLYFGGGSINLADIVTVITLVHASAGVIAALLGVWLVSSWHLKADLQGCFRKKRVMDVTIGLWVLAIVLGIVIYLKIVGAF